MEAAFWAPISPNVAKGELFEYGVDDDMRQSEPAEVNLFGRDALPRHHRGRRCQK